jgi:hypothetical protein
MAAMLDIGRNQAISYSIEIAVITDHKVDILSFPIMYHMSGASNYTQNQATKTD